MWRGILARGRCEIRVSHQGVVHFDTGDNLVVVNGQVLFSRCPRPGVTAREAMGTCGDLIRLTPFGPEIEQAYERVVTSER